MKYKHLIILFLTGLLLTIAGALYKIMHLEFGFVTGNLLLATGMSLKFITIILLIVKLASNRKQDNFLNK